jgi:cytoskeletal protein RodZ
MKTALIIVMILSIIVSVLAITFVVFDFAQDRKRSKQATYEQPEKAKQATPKVRAKSNEGSYVIARRMSPPRVIARKKITPPITTNTTTPTNNTNNTVYDR